MIQEIEIYSNEGCPYCDMAIDLAKTCTDSVVIYSFNEGDFTREELIDRIPPSSRKERLTVPQIFVNGQYVGGYTEFKSFIS